MPPQLGSKSCRCLRQCAAICSCSARGSPASQVAYSFGTRLGGVGSGPLATEVGGERDGGGGGIAGCGRGGAGGGGAVVEST